MPRSARERVPLRSGSCTLLLLTSITEYSVHNLGMRYRDRHFVVVKEHLDRVPVGYASWADWRSGHVQPAVTWSNPLTRQCPFCWGQRTIWEPGPLGLLPVVCGYCAGTGRFG